MQKVLVLIKPNAVRNKQVGEIIKRLEEQSFSIISMKMLKLTRDEAENFYYIHRGQPYFKPLIDFMLSEKCIPIVLEGKNIIKEVRSFIGPTDPQEAKPGTIRADFGQSVRENAIHASDGEESARFEVNYFFPELVE